MNYWDRERDELVARKEKIGEMAKKLKDEGKLSPDEQKAGLAVLRGRSSQDSEVYAVVPFGRWGRCG